MKAKYFKIFLICNVLVQSLCQTNGCSHKNRCNECIQLKCAWCSQPDFNETARCFQPSDPSSTSKCASQYTVNPTNSMSLIKNENLTLRLPTGSQTAKITQIKPQRIQLKLRINQEYHFYFNYSQAEDYPVDLYYLMDLSNSMLDDKNELSKLGDSLSKTMKNITSKYQIGFGSFVDKVLMPFVSTVPENLKTPCPGCSAPYGFHNDMPLSMDTDLFIKKVREANISGNLDSPEGGFDAIMQAIVCREQIKWRDQARRLLVFSTDAGFHIAGDGKLGGVITPNDGECHLDSDGYDYIASSTLDYPSISQINYKVKQNAINVIFAVTETQSKVYQELSEMIEGSSTAILKTKKMNVVELIHTEYNKIVSSVEMKDNSNENIKITYTSACLSSENPKEVNKCNGLKKGDVVKFGVKIVVQTCPKDLKERKQTIQIYPVGINESLIIDLEMLCSCDCEKSDYSLNKANSDKCTNHGTYQCGICECDNEYVGRNCECSVLGTESDEKSSGCRPDNTTEVDCNRRGNCICNVCDCNKRENPNEEISGPYCECDNYSCERSNNLVCSGSKQGICNCGTCECISGWTGLACDCRDTITTCLPPNGGPICSGHGACECGECKCNSTDGVHHTGKFCEKCPKCPNQCDEYKNCVSCKVHETGPFKTKSLCTSKCEELNVTIEENLEKTEEEIHCSIHDDDDCNFSFFYSNKGDKIIVRADTKRDCAIPDEVLYVILGVTGAIVFMGLAILLLWKLLTTIHDRREFARFEKERQSPKWNNGGNPMYKQPDTTFNNPTYTGK